MLRIVLQAIFYPLLMAIHFVLIYYLISQSTALANTFGKGTPSLPSVIFPDVSNSSLLSVTYDSFPSPSFKSRIRTIFPGTRLGNSKRNVALSDYLNGGNQPTHPVQASQTFSFRSRFPALSPFVPTLSLPPLERPRNQNNFNRTPSNYPRFVHQSSRNHRPIQMTFATTTTAPLTPNPSLPNVSATIVDNFSTETVIPVNLSSHFKLANTHQQQRVVLNNIQDIINSLKNEETRNGTRKRETGQPKIVFIKSTNQTVNGDKSKANKQSVFKLRFFEKLKEHQNLLRSRLETNSTKLAKKSPPFTAKGKSEHIDPLPIHLGATKLSNNSLEVFSKTLSSKSGFTKANSSTSGSLTPSVPSRTQFQFNKLTQLELIGPERGASPTRTTTGKSSKQQSIVSRQQPSSTGISSRSEIKRTSEGDQDKGKFMSHLKDLLSRFEHKPGGQANIYLNSTVAEKSQSTASSHQMHQPDLSPIDYGEVERILAYVNPYGRRISMPPSIEYTQAESQTHENRNFRFQRSTSDSEWKAANETNGAMDTSATSFEDALWNQVMASNETEESDDDRESWFNSLLDQDGSAVHPSETTSTTDPFDFITFPTSNNFSKQISPEEDEIYKSLKIHSTQQPQKTKFGLRNQQQVQHIQPNQQMTDSMLNNDSESPFGGVTRSSHSLPAINSGDFMQIDRTPINYDPKESEFTRYPREQFVGGEKWRQPKEKLFVDTERDWVAYFRDLERKMKLDSDSISLEEPPNEPKELHETGNPSTETIEPSYGRNEAPISEGLPRLISSPFPRPITQLKAHERSNPSFAVPMAPNNENLLGVTEEDYRLLESSLPIFDRMVSLPKKWPGEQVTPMIRGRHYPAPLRRAHNRLLQHTPMSSYRNRGIQSLQEPRNHQPSSPYHLARVIQYAHQPFFSPFKHY